MKLSHFLLSLILVIVIPITLISFNAMAFDHSHKAWTETLKTYTVIKGPVGQFKYKSLKTNRQKFVAYLNTLSSVSQKEFDGWDAKQQQAFLINAYNAFTVKLIIDNYPVKSIKKIGGFFSSPWKLEFFKLLGKKRYLDWIEHEVLRKKYKEARVHFAVNCASIGCPMLMGTAFTADQLDSQLSAQAKLFLTDKSRNSVDPAKKSIYLSKIFDWFEDDFKKSSGSVAKFVAPYMTDDKTLQGEIASGKFKIKYNTYDWDLNGAK